MSGPQLGSLSRPLVILFPDPSLNMELGQGHISLGFSLCNVLYAVQSCCFFLLKYSCFKKGCPTKQKRYTTMLKGIMGNRIHGSLTEALGVSVT